MADSAMFGEEASSSSGEEFVDLEMGYASSEPDNFDAAPSEMKFRRRQYKTELRTNIAQLEHGDETEEEEKPQNEDEDGPTYKIIGQENEEKKTKPTRTPVASWVANAHKFPTISGEQGLLPLDTFGHLREEFMPILQEFTKVWFPVQRAVLPLLLNERNGFLPPRDLVICSPTGSGKTLCYVLPILNKLVNTGKSPTSVFALVVAPVFNLAQQILKEFEKFNVFGAKIVSLIGTTEYGVERSKMFPNDSTLANAHVIVATPGRLVEHLLDEKGHINLSMLRFLVVDEADRMQDTARMEWLDLVERRANVSSTNLLNLHSLTDSRKNRWLQKILVSATLSLDIHKLHSWSLRCPRLFMADPNFEANNGEKEAEAMEFDRPEQAIMLPATLELQLLLCQQKFKPLHLYQQIMRNKKKWRRIIVFCNKRMTGNRLTTLLNHLSNGKFAAAEFSSNLFKNRRQKLLKQFKDGKIRVLVSCDMLSRGIDVENVDCVVNYDVPINERIFVHRAGRTARAMKSGLLLSLTTKEEKMRLKKLLIAQNLWEKVQIVETKELDESALEKYKEALEKLQKSAEKQSS